MPSTVTEAYRVISEGLLEGFKLLGFEAYFAIPRSKEEREKLQPRSAVCFDAPSWYELVVEGRKLQEALKLDKKALFYNMVPYYKMLTLMSFSICSFLK